MIQTRYDQQRGCGWRTPGGLYLMAGGVAAPCGKLPLPLTTCPTCSAGVKFARGWTWVDVGTEVITYEVRQSRRTPASWQRHCANRSRARSIYLVEGKRETDD